MKTIASFLLILALVVPSMAANHPFNPNTDLGTTPSLELPGSLQRAKEHHKKVLVLLYDPKGRYEYNGLLLQAFADLTATKTLIKQFVLVLLPFANKEASTYLQPSDDKERPMYLLLGEDGALISKGAALGDARQGLEIMKDLTTKANGSPAPAQ